MMTLSTVHPPSSGIRHQQPATEAHVSSQNYGSGTLYITEGCVKWIGSNGQGITLDYPSISLHAVSRDTSSFPHECLYLMIDSGEEDQMQNEGGSDDEEEVGGPYEVRFVPEDKGTLDLLYKSMCDCQMLHPDPEDEQSGDDDYFADEDDVENLTPEGQAQLERLENIFLSDNRMNMEADQEPPVGGAQHSVNGNHANGDAPMDDDQFEDAE